MAGGEMDFDLEDCLTTAVELAKKAGEMIRAAIYEEKSVETKDGYADLVTKTDKAVEDILLSGLRSKYPSHRFIGEETASADKNQCEFTNEPTWMVDPIDGTTNFVHRIADVAVSIGLVINKEPSVGVVYVPMRGEMFTAIKGKGAFRNGKPIQAHKVEELRQAVVLLEAGSSRDKSVLEKKMQDIHSVVTACHGIRMYGSAAINLCRVACGEGEAYTECGMHCWDMAAGTCIAREAGAVVMDPSGGELDLMSRGVLCASTEKLARELAPKVIRVQFPRD